MERIKTHRELKVYRKLDEEYENIIGMLVNM